MIEARSEASSVAIEDRMLGSWVGTCDSIELSSASNELTAEVGIAVGN